MKGNDFVRLALRSPLHLLMGDTMLITVTGRRTGREITTPVNFYRDDGNLWIVSLRCRKWWRNIRPGGPVRLHLHGKDIPGTAGLMLDPQSVASRLGDYFRHVPMAARALRVQVHNGEPDTKDLERLASERVFISVSLPNSTT